MAGLAEVLQTRDVVAAIVRNNRAPIIARIALFINDPVLFMVMVTYTLCLPMLSLALALPLISSRRLSLNLPHSVPARNVACARTWYENRTLWLPS